MQAVSEPPRQELLTDVGGRLWMAWHLFQEGDLEGVLWEVVRPAVVTLWQERRVDGFFFIRYPEGGNHVRLRLRLAPGLRPEQVEPRAGELLGALAGSWRPRPSERGGDPSPITLRRLPFEPEVERYGGAELLPLSLDFFALSSVDALRFVSQWGRQPRSRQLTEVLRRLLDQALGLARDWPEALALMDYFAGRKQEMAPIVARADQAFESRREHFVLSFRGSLQRWLEQGPVEVLELALLAEAGRCLAQALEGLGPQAREHVKASQMHMTANRLGLLNPEESYLTRLMCRSAAELQAHEPSLLRAVDEWLRGRGPLEQPAQRLAALVAMELDRLAVP